VAGISPQEFVSSWGNVELTERASSQPHFIDLCRLLDQPTPTEADPTGDFYTFERGATKAAGPTKGKRGWADVWKKGHFAWEYKGPHANLEKAYQQLQQYRESLENPPLLVVSDIRTIQVHTNFTNSVKQVTTFELEDLLDPEKLDRLRLLWTDPDAFRASETPEQVTEKAAREFARLAEQLRRRGEEPDRAAHFLIRLLFCLFAEDVRLLPNDLFGRLVAATRANPAAFSAQLRQLFGAMRTGGFFGIDQILRFNGGLFDDEEVLELDADGLRVLGRLTGLDWGSIEPAILGTLFERSLDPSKRAQLGAHYTSSEDILAVVEPVLMAPLRRSWSEVQERAMSLIERRDAASSAGTRTQRQNDLSRLLVGFSDEIAETSVLDPACGSGNFLYVSLKQLLDLEKQVITFSDEAGLPKFFPKVGPEQVHGIELNEYAHDLATATVWIGYIQWLRDNGFGQPAEPILKPLETVEQMDAVLARGEDGTLREPDWPEADVIVGNPPFLGDKKMRTELGHGYVEELRRLYGGRVPGGADLVCYWFEKAREQIEKGRTERAGLLATSSIRGGANRRVLERVKESGDIFFAVSERPWVLAGAAVEVSMAGFDGGAETEKMLDGAPAEEIFADLDGSLDITAARRLPENSGLGFVGDTKKGKFELTLPEAEKILATTGNPNGRPNSDVVRPWINALDVTRRYRDMWIVDFGVSTPEEEAALYEGPFEHVRRYVKPARDLVRNHLERARWWLHGRPAPDMRSALAGRGRFLCTPLVSKHRLFVWFGCEILPSHATAVFAREDDYFFGVLHSRPHELWALRMGTSLEDRPRYTPTTCFETFPMPWPPGEEPEDDPLIAEIAEAARRLDELRRNSLQAEGASEADLKKLTLTNLYNARPTWLDNAHKKLDAAVFAAYGWPEDIADEDILKNLLALNLERSERGAPLIHPNA
jgi:type II restriction/modification system DNA methylase subunit YeeA